MCETHCCALQQDHLPNKQFIIKPSLPIWPPKQQSSTAFYLLDIQNEDEMTELLLTREMQLPWPVRTWIFMLRSGSGDSGALSCGEEQPNPREGAHCWEEALWDRCMWLPSLGLLGWCFMSSGPPNGHLQIIFSVLLGIHYCRSSFCLIIPVKQWPFPDYLLKKPPKAVHLKNPPNSWILVPFPRREDLSFISLQFYQILSLMKQKWKWTETNTFCCSEKQQQSDPGRHEVRFVGTAVGFLPSIHKPRAEKHEDLEKPLPYLPFSLVHWF